MESASWATKLTAKAWRDGRSGLPMRIAVTGRFIVRADEELTAFL